MEGIISECCDAFIHYIDNNCICSCCNKIIGQVGDDDELTTSIHYNTSSTDNLISNDLIESDHKKDRRLAHDITCSLSDVKCKKCGSYTRITRDNSNKCVYICTECRNVESF